MRRAVLLAALVILTGCRGNHTFGNYTGTVVNERFWNDEWGADYEAIRFETDDGESFTFIPCDAFLPTVGERFSFTLDLWSQQPGCVTMSAVQSLSHVGR